MSFDKPIEFRPWWIRIFSFPFAYTIGHVLYTARMANFFMQRPSIVRLARSWFNKDIRPAKTVWEEEYQNKSSENLNYIYEKREGLATYVFEPKKTEEVPLEKPHKITVFYPAKAQGKFGRFETVEKITVPKARYYTIHCPGTSGRCERHFAELEEIATLTNRTTITFSPPGVGESEGYVLDQDDLVNAMFLQAQFLIGQGVRPDHITLAGMSMGAAVAALTVEKINQYYDQDVVGSYSVSNDAGQFKGVYYFGDRTFCNMTDEIIDQIPLYPLNLLLWPLIKFLLIIMNWDMQPQKAYDEMDKTKRAVVHVEPKAKGEKGTLARTCSVFFCSYDQYGDAKIRAHVALQTSQSERAAFKENLKFLEEKILASDFQAAKGKVGEMLEKKEVINAIVHSELVKLKTILDANPAENSDALQQQFNKVKMAFKAERLEGVDKQTVKSKDAHDARYNQLYVRQSKKCGVTTDKQPFINHVQTFYESTVVPESKKF